MAGNEGKIPRCNQNVVSKATETLEKYLSIFYYLKVTDFTNSVMGTKKGSRALIPKLRMEENG